MDSLTSWTDDIPICKQSGIGTATNEIYRMDGRRAEMHPMQDRHFHFSQEEFNLSLYGLFDGFQGSAVSDFAMKRMPAELLLGQLSPNSADDTIREVVRQAFVSVDREYFESIMGTITSRIVLKQDPEISPDDPNLKRLESLTSIGSSATLAVLLNNKLFVASCGDTRAVLCLQLPSGELKVLKMSVDHVFGNEDEDLRLRQLGIDPARAEQILSPPGYTRCLGFHKVKGCFQEEEAFKAAKDEPVIADPEILGGIAIEPSFQFLLLFSRSLTDYLSQVSSSEGDITKELCQITMEQFSENTTVTGVAQSVVDQIVRRHREQFEETSAAAPALECRTREDITLLVRKFSAKLRRKKSSMANEEGGATTMKIRPTQSSTTTESSDVFVKNVRELPVDEDGCIRPYVDFSYFHEEWSKHRQQQNGTA